MPDFKTGKRRAINFPNGLTAFNNTSLPITVATVAELIALPSKKLITGTQYATVIKDGQVAIVTGGSYLVFYKYKSSETSSHNGESVLTPADATSSGRWLLSSGVGSQKYVVRTPVANNVMSGQFIELQYGIDSLKYGNSDVFTINLDPFSAGSSQTHVSTEFIVNANNSTIYKKVIKDPDNKLQVVLPLAVIAEYPTVDVLIRFRGNSVYVSNYAKITLNISVNDGSIRSPSAYTDVSSFGKKFRLNNSGSKLTVGAPTSQIAGAAQGSKITVGALLLNSKQADNSYLTNKLINGTIETTEIPVSLGTSFDQAAVANIIAYTLPEIVNGVYSPNTYVYNQDTNVTTKISTNGKSGAAIAISSTGDEVFVNNNFSVDPAEKGRVYHYKKVSGAYTLFDTIHKDANSELAYAFGKNIVLSKDGSVLLVSEQFKITSDNKASGVINIYRRSALGQTFAFETSLEMTTTAVTNAIGGGAQLTISQDNNTIAASWSNGLAVKLIKVFKNNNGTWDSTVIDNVKTVMDIDFNNSTTKMFVGSNCDQDTYFSTGKVIIYTLQQDNTWAVSKTITPPLLKDNNIFGCCVRFNNSLNKLFVGTAVSNKIFTYDMSGV